MDAIESKLRADIESYGWHVLNVLPEGDHPPHSYSVGLFSTFGHPEIVIVGLPADTAHRLINDIGEEVRDGASFEAGCRYGHILDGYDVMFVRVEPELYDDHFGRAIDYYEAATFPVLQMVWPDRDHAFPWEPACSQGIRELQPVLIRGKQ